jgi:hypothetical protein
MWRAREGRGGGSEVLHPLYWPRWLRRVALLLFPVAIPLWFALLLAVFMLACARALARPLMILWNAPRRRRISYYYGTAGLAHTGLAPRPDARPRHGNALGCTADSQASFQ